MWYAFDLAVQIFVLSVRHIGILIKKEIFQRCRMHKDAKRAIKLKGRLLLRDFLPISIKASSTRLLLSTTRGSLFSYMSTRLCVGAAKIMKHVISSILVNIQAD